MYNIVKQLQDAKGSKAKQAILDANKGNELFKNFMQAVYDPALSYYQTNIKLKPEDAAGGSMEFGQEDIDFARNILAARLLTGTASVKALGSRTAALNEEGRALMAMLIKRSVGGSVGETMVLKTWPGLFFIPSYMRCSGMSPKVKEMYAAMPFFYVQTKYDGSFGYLKTGVNASLFTRAGSHYPFWLAEKLAKGTPEGFVLMGEVLVYENGVALSRKVSNGILNSLLQKCEESEADIRMIAWDMVTLKEFEAGESTTPYNKRLAGVDWFAGNTCLEVASTKNVTSLEQAFAINREAMLRGEEGTVWKNPEGHWKHSSSGSRDAIKVKVVFEAEYVVTGKFEGEGKAKGMLGGFTVQSSCGGIVCNVGSGFSDQQRKEYWEADTDGWIVTLKANDVISREGSTTESLFLPIFEERRLDKGEADSRERVLQQMQAAKEGS